MDGDGVQKTGVRDSDIPQPGLDGSKGRKDGNGRRKTGVDGSDGGKTEIDGSDAEIELFSTVPKKCEAGDAGAASKKVNEAGTNEKGDSDAALAPEMKKKEEDTPKKVKRRRSGKKHGIGVPINCSSAATPVKPQESKYVIVPEDFCAVKGEQSAELGEENKSFLWFLIKQLRPGMDLSRVVLPTFILEPRSFLDRMSDYYYHADYLSRATAERDPLRRMIAVVRWYISGFYKKPKGLKKPYNPILGETFRCMWTHPSGSRTFYIAEQVSHHPPITALYVTNRKDGFVISAAITTKSRFYGNSTTAILDGVATLSLLTHGETYEMTMPFVHCKGIVLGNLSMELGGQVSIACPTTGYLTELDFKINSMLSRGDQTNRVSGKIKFGTETLLTVDGHWDDKITVRDKGSDVDNILWEVTDEVKASRLIRYTIPLEDQGEKESEKLWLKVSEAIGQNDQEGATIEKMFLEDEQRHDVDERKAKKIEWKPKYFRQEETEWRYEHEDLSPWDDNNDILQYEHNHAISTFRKRDTPDSKNGAIVPARARQLSTYELLQAGSSDKVVPAFHQRASNRQLVDLLRQLLTRQMEQSEEIEQLKEAVAEIQLKLRPKQEDPFRMTSTILAVVLGVAMQIFVILFWFSDGKLIPVIRKPF